MALVAAATIVAELGDISRFSKAEQLMSFLGLVPSEDSSGKRRRQGGITKAGNGAARRMLVEAAWSYRFPARISREQLLRQEQLAAPIRAIAWKAQERLCFQYRKLSRAANRSRLSLQPSPANSPASSGRSRTRSASQGVAIVRPTKGDQARFALIWIWAKLGARPR
jgi:hypothetical protein